MKFIDEAIITVRSGNGGNGCVSFRREKFIPKGGPDGGDGGHGGSIIIRASLRKRTLQQFQFRRIFNAPHGKPGQGKQMTGHSGQDLIIEVPPGTIVADADSGAFIADLNQPGQETVVAAGGRGGAGNIRFKSSVNRAPRFAKPGESGQQLKLKLELKLLADVGLVGLPNAGKSTLIRALSAARPKIGAYPFTTLEPSLGVVYPEWGGEPFVVADIPGLITGASQGAGLGIRFLRHIERTRAIVHLIDVSAINIDDPLADYQIIRHELEAYSLSLAAKPQLVVLNKCDLPETEKRADCLKRLLGDMPVLTASALTGQGAPAIVSALCQLLSDT